jgi:hypothetical protein
MNQLEFFLREHAGVHLKEAAPADFNIDWLLDGLTEEQLRACPHGLNSIAWLLWHVARVEDACVSLVVGHRPQLLDDAWAVRLGVDERGDGEGMTKAAVAELSVAIDLGAQREYRNAVCRRTRNLATELWPDGWETPLTAEDITYANESRALEADAQTFLVGQPREALLLWWGLHHTHYHLGQASMIRGLVTRGQSPDGPGS